MWKDQECEKDQPFAWGLEADLGTKFLLTNASNISQIMGRSVTLVGASGGLGPGAGVEFSVMTEDDYYTPISKSAGTPVWELSGSFYPYMPGGTFGAEAHGRTKNITVGFPFGEE